MRLPADILHTDAMTAALQDFCGVLHAEGAFAGLSGVNAESLPSDGVSGSIPVSRTSITAGHS